jgi:hypothetical protein
MNRTYPTSECPEDFNRSMKFLVVLSKFIIKNKITCAEALYQVDSINEQLPEIMDELCQIAGYYVGPKENKK